LSRRGSKDIVSGNGGAVPGDKHALRVFKNPGNANNWLNLHLVGVRSNRAAFGAQIHLTVQTGKSEPRSIYRTVGQTSSFGGNPIEQLIGLGRDAYTVTLDIRWPTSKSRQHFANVAPNQYIEVKEFASGYTRLERHPFPLGTSDSSRSASASRQSK